MASSSRKHPFFQHLRTVAATVSNDVKEIERKMQNSKFELPENNAMFKLIQLCDDVNTYKNDSQAFLQQLCGENQKYVCYRKDIELLADEMERSIDRVEELLTESEYGYQKWHPECVFSDDHDQLTNTCNETPLKEILPAVSMATQEKQQSALQKTPVLADYGLTAKIPKHLPSALKDKQSILKSTKKQVHFESPESQSDLKGKENRVPYLFQKTPLLEDYGLPSRRRNIHMPETQDALCVKKQLNFRSPLGSVSKNSTHSADLLPFADIDNTDDFRELVNSLNSGDKVNVEVSKVQSNVKLSTPEEPFRSCSQRIRFANKRQNETVTPEEPEIQPIRMVGTSKIVNETVTPEEPEIQHIRMLGTSKIMDAELSTPKTSELPLASSFENWLQSQKKK